MDLTSTDRLLHLALVPVCNPASRVSQLHTLSAGPWGNLSQKSWRCTPNFKKLHLLFGNTPLPICQSTQANHSQDG